MLYEELYNHVTNNKSLVVMCIDSHFTAFQVMGNKTLLFYDPMSPTLQMVSGEDYTTLVLFCLLKCAYGDSQHIQEHEDHYTSPTSGRLNKKMLFP